MMLKEKNSRSDDNRRAAGAVGFFSIWNSFYPNKSFSRLTARRRGILYYYRSFSCFSEKIFSKA